jgi:hypothetical protein
LSEVTLTPFNFQQESTPILWDDYNPVKKIAMHKNMNYVIAGVEQQKADDLAVIDRNLTQ